MQNIDKIKKFDRQLEQACESSFFNGKAGSFMLCGLGLLFMMIPVELSEVMISIVCAGCILCMTGVYQYMQIYLKAWEGGKNVSVYKKLKYMPVAKAEIRKVRFGYLNRFCIKISTAGFFLQQLMSFLNHSFGLTSVLFAAAWAAFIWITGILTVLQS